MKMALMSARSRFLGALVLLGTAYGQPLLTPDEAVRLALERNFGLALAKDQTEIAANNRRAGIGPFLPSADASLVNSGRLDGSSSQSRLGVSANLQVFDGFQSYHAYHRLSAQERSTQWQERLTLESTLEQVLVGYFDIVQQKQRLAAIRELLGVSLERAKLAEAKLELGAGSRLDQLQSVADLNEDSSAFLSQQVSLQRAKVGLNRLLARDPGLDFEVADSIPLQTALPVAEWQAGLKENNSSIRQALAQRRVADAGVKESRGRYLPNLSTGVGYGTAAETLIPRDNLAGREGLTYSVNLSVPLFDRLATPTAVRNARIGLRQEEIRLKETEQGVRGDFEQARRQYETGVHQVTLEERNLQVARLQSEAARERFRLGASTSLEFRDAQRRLLDAESRLIAARQTTLQAELALKRLAGLLVKDTPAAGNVSPPAGDGKGSGG